MSGLWPAVLITAVGCYLLKLLGLMLPQAVLDRRMMRRVADLVPVALLAALVAVHVLATGSALVVDARLAGLGAGAVALMLRAPFLVVVVVAAAAAAVIRLL